MTFAATCRENLIAIATAYAAARKKPMTLAQVSRKFYGNASFLDSFATGKMTITIDKYDEMIGKFKAAWPANGDWPFLHAIIIEHLPRG